MTFGFDEGKQPICAEKIGGHSVELFEVALA